MTDLGKILTRKVQHVGVVIVARGKDDSPATILLLLVQLVYALDQKIISLAFHRDHSLVVFDGELKVIGDSAIVLQAIHSLRFLRGDNHGDSTDLKQISRGEKFHIDGIAVDRMDQTTLLNQPKIEVSLFRLDRAGQTCRSPANDNPIQYLIH